jgi:hypothetical protein
MKSILLTAIFSLCFFFMKAQVNSLPSGRYETTLKSKGSRWEIGDIIIIDDSRYKISSNDETGEYRFSSTAQRIFFISGPLKSLFAKTLENDRLPVILIPATENEQLGFKIVSADVWCLLKN